MHPPSCEGIAAGIVVPPTATHSIPAIAQGDFTLQIWLFSHYVRNCKKRVLETQGILAKQTLTLFEAGG